MMSQTAIKGSSGVHGLLSQHIEPLTSQEGQMVQKEQWHLAGSAPDVYERYLVPALFGPWAPVLIAAAALRPGDRVLDLACGTGVVARQAKSRVGASGTVTGVDLNPGMLAIARSVEPSVDWQEGNAGALPFADGSFEVVFCQLGLQYFPDRSAALREMHRVLAPNGRAVLLVWRPIQHSPGFAILADVLERHVGGHAATIMRAPFGLGDAEELRTLMIGVEFKDVAIRSEEGTVHFPSAEDFIRCQVAGSPLAGPVGQVDDHARQTLIQEVSGALQSFTGAQGLLFPIQGHVVTART
jgi:SAM-dependent methyltransferase